jgi:hypothetical protein
VTATSGAADPGVASTAIRSRRGAATPSGFEADTGGI